jgi:hypothetical protein
MLYSASSSSALKLHLVIKFSKPEKKLPKNQVEGDIPLESFGRGAYPHPSLEGIGIVLLLTDKRIVARALRLWPLILLQD